MRTKIVCTLGPASNSEAVVRDLIRAGMDVARVNFSHGTHEEHAQRIALVRRLAREEKCLVAIMGDLQGPKFRVGVIPGDGIHLSRDQEVVLAAHDAFSASSANIIIPLPHEDLISAAQSGQRVLIDDGAMEMRIVSAPDHGQVTCRVITGGNLTSHKGVAILGAHLSVSAITDKDRDDTKFAVEQKLDALALSFVRSSADVRALRSLVKSFGGDQIIVAKIEKPEAVNDLANILREVDVIMVARGDLGVEAPAEEVPFFQKKIIQSCLYAGVPVITATQMLQSMIHAPLPTRAEASDVANAVLDGTDAVMLSAETAAGEYPIEAVNALARIASRAESDCCAGAMIAMGSLRETGGDMPSPDAITEAISRAAVEIAHGVGACAIVCTTQSGFTARMVARFRPKVPIIALTSDHRTYQFTAFMWDVRAEEMPIFSGADEMFDAARRIVLEGGKATPGDRIIITAGLPLGNGAGTTNLIKVHTI